MKYALIQNGAVFEVIEPFCDSEGREVPIEKRFHADFVAQTLPIPEGADVAAGYTVNVEGAFAPPPPPKEADPADGVRAARGALLAASDWTQLADIPEKVRSAWAAYRQALRNVPQQDTFPKNVAWPNAPK